MGIMVNLQWTHIVTGDGLCRIPPPREAAACFLEVKFRPGVTADMMRDILSSVQGLTSKLSDEMSL